MIFKKSLLRSLLLLVLIPVIFFGVDYLSGRGMRANWQYILIGAVTVGTVIFYLIRSGRQQGILKNGIRGKAKILAVEDTGLQVNFKPQLRIKLLVSIPSTPPYEVTHTESIDYHSITKLEIGKEVKVIVHEKDQNRLVINWSENLSIDNY